jgi:glycine/D-amino acid oxidase-like deaminating enzyme
MAIVPDRADVLIVGAGIIGLTLARRLVMAGCGKGPGDARFGA